MKLIYLSGAIQDVSFEESNHWRKIIDLRLNDYADVFNPNDHFTMDDMWKNGITPESVMKYDLHMLKKSDLVIVNFAHPKSLGTMAEIAIAYDRGIPIIGWREPYHSWQKAMCDVYFHDLEDVIEYVLVHYI